MGGPRIGSRERQFARRLSQALDAHPRCPEEYGRLTWVKRELAHQKIDVTIETVRKWLSGETMPRRPKMAALAKVLMVDETWLAMGVHPANEAGTAGSPERVVELVGALRRIADMTADPRIKAIIKDATGE
jgi:transcriptional regulator with XRE-family HTH domain